MTDLFPPSLFFSRNKLLTNISLVEILHTLALSQPSSGGFRSLMNLPLDLFGWSLFSLEFPFGEVDIGRGNDYPSQWLKFPDPLLKSARLSGSVSNFRLLSLFKAVFLKITSLPVRERIVTPPLRTEMESPWKRLLSSNDIYLIAALDLLLEIILLLVWGIIHSTEFALILRFSFQKGRLKLDGSLNTVLAYNSLDCLCALLVSNISSRNSFPKRSLSSFWRNSDFAFNIVFACDKLYMTPYSTPSLLRCETAMLVRSTRSTLYKVKLRKYFKTTVKFPPSFLLVLMTATVLHPDFSCEYFYGSNLGPVTLFYVFLLEVEAWIHQFSLLLAYKKVQEFW